MMHRATVSPRLLRRSLLVICIACACGNPALAEDWFNPALLGASEKSDTESGKKANGAAPAAEVDDAILQRLANGQQPPGNYVVDVYVNDHSAGRQSVMLTVDGPGNTLTPAWSVNQLLSMGVKPEVLAEKAEVKSDAAVKSEANVNSVTDVKADGGAENDAKAAEAGSDTEATGGTEAKTEVKSEATEGNSGAEVHQGELDLTPEQGDTPVKGILNYVPGTRVHFDFARQRLNVTVPQLMMVKDMSGATDPRFWDHGITALVTDYSFNAWKSQGDGAQTDSNSDSAYLSMNNSLNMGAWRLHNFSTWSRMAKDAPGSGETEVTQQWESVNTWLERPIAKLRGLLSVGDYYTPSDVFDSVQFRGGQLASDEEMNPDYLNEFAPVVQGIASTNAQVIVRQNGSIVYQTTVAPGPFTIKDIPSSSQSGDFYVTVREADGSEHSFVQGNSAVAVMQRQGQVRYAFTGGKLRSSGSNTREPEFVQGTLIYGLPYDLTVYGGMLASQEYQAGSLGMGALLGVAGAVSVDVTHAKTDIAQITGQDEDGVDSGQSVRMRYSKMVAATDSTLTMTALKNSSGGYWTFGDAYALDNDDESMSVTDDGIIMAPVNNHRVATELQMSLSQSFSDTFGSLGVNASRKTFHDIDGEEASLSVNWNMNIKGVSLGLGYQLSKWADVEQEDERIVSLSVSLPLQQWLGTKHSLYTSSNFMHSDTGRKTMNNSVGGTLLDDNNLSWNVGQSSVRTDDNSGGDSDNGNLSMTYSGGQGEVSAGYSYSPDNRQYDVGLKGGVIVSRYGLTLSQTPGETIALVHAPGAENLKVSKGTGVTTDYFGNTAVQVQPYQRNKIDIDILSAGQNVTLGETSKVVIPSRGAVVLAEYSTAVGHQMLMTLTRQGKPLPFGSIASLQREGSAKADSAQSLGGNGIVGDGGQVWLSGMPAEGVLNVVWGEGAAGTCQVRYKLDKSAIKEAEENHLPVTVTGVCP